MKPGASIRFRPTPPDWEWARQITTRGDFFRLQYAKLINYFPDQLAPEWGGAFFATGDYRQVLLGVKAFEAYCSQFSDHVWVSRPPGEHFWRPETIVLSDVPDPSLGHAFEPYLALSGVVLGVRQAAQYLQASVAQVYRWKLDLLVDAAVVAAAITGRLRVHSVPESQ